MLSPGARIAVFAASGPVDRQALEASLHLVRLWGLEPVLPPEIAPCDYLAGTDAARLAQLEWALSTPDCSAAWAARGGYGLTRILPRLAYSGLVPRPVIGFSDVTALLCALEKRGWTELVHGPNLQGLAGHCDEASREALRRLLLEGTVPRLEGIFTGHGPRGKLLGGNLAVLASLAGTSDQLDARAALLLLEDVNEAPYRLDRYLTQLHATGCLDGLRGAALGDFQQGRDEDRAREVLTEMLEGWKVPVLRSVPVGHGSRNLPFRLGWDYAMTSAGLVG